MKLELKIDISRRTILFLSIFFLFILIASATSFSSNQLLINQTTGMLFGNTSVNQTTIVTDFLHGNGSNITSVNADTVDGYHLNQGVRTTDSPTFASVNSNYYNTSDGRELQNGGCDASYCIGYNLTNSSIIEAVNGTDGSKISGTNLTAITQTMKDAGVSGIIRFGAGVFVAKPSLPSNNNTIFEGSGNTTIQYDGGYLTPLGSRSPFYFASGENNITIRNFIFTQNQTDNNANSALFVSNSRDITFENNIILNLSNSTGYVFCYTANVSRCMVNNNNMYMGTPTVSAPRMIYFDASSDSEAHNNYLSFTGSVVGGKTPVGIEMDDITTGGVVSYGQNNKAVNNNISGTWHQGIQVEGQENALVADNTIVGGDSTTSNGVLMTRSTRFSTVSRNHFRYMSGYAIEMDMNSTGDQTVWGYNTVVGNTVLHGRAGIHLTNASNHNIVSQNTIYNTSSNALWISENASNNTISLNIVNTSAANTFWEATSARDNRIINNEFNKAPSQKSPDSTYRDNWNDAGYNHGNRANCTTITAFGKFDTCGNTTSNKLQFYNGTAWETVTSS